LTKKSIAVLVLAAALLFSAAGGHTRIPDGWPFLDFNAAIAAARQQHKPMFVYFGFATCPYCLYLNRNTFSFDALRERYSAHYVLAYFDVRADRGDTITLPGGGELTRGEAIKRFKVTAVPAWMFVDPDGRVILMRRGSRTGVEAFLRYDQYVESGAYRQQSFEEFLGRRGLTEERVE
jgi:thioredoxin-related protein